MLLGLWELQFVQDTTLCQIHLFFNFFFLFPFTSGSGEIGSLPVFEFCQMFFLRQACSRHSRLVGQSQWHRKHLWLKTLPLHRQFNLHHWTEPLVKISSCHHLPMMSQGRDNLQNTSWSIVRLWKGELSHSCPAMDVIFGWAWICWTNWWCLSWTYEMDWLGRGTEVVWSAFVQHGRSWRWKSLGLRTLFAVCLSCT